MAEVKWIKITVSMFDDEKIKLIEAMPEGDSILVVFLKLLTLAGRTNSNGYIFFSEKVAYSEEMLATIFNKNLQTLRLAIVTLREFGMIEVEDNGYILLKNFDKHQNTDGLTRIKAQAANRQKKFRERANNLLNQHTSENSNVISNGDVTLRVTESNATDIDIDNRKKNKILKDKNFAEKNSAKSKPVEKVLKEQTLPEKVHTRAIEVWMDYYAGITGIKYIFQGGKDGKNMQEIMKKLEKVLTKERTEENILEALKKFLNGIVDEWILKNLDLANVNCKFNQILNQIKNGSKQASKGFNPADLKGFIAEQRERLNIGG